MSIDVDINNIVKIIGQKIPKEVRQKFLFSLLIGFVTHFYVISNMIINHDSLVFSTEKKPDITAGRWARVFIGNLFTGDYQSPWMIGVITILFFSVSALLIVHYLRVRWKWQEYLIIALLMTYPVLASYFSYMFMSNEYAIALFLTLIGLNLSENGKIQYNVLAILAYVISCAIYQSFVQVAGVLLVIRLVFTVLEDEDIWNGVKQFIKGGLFLLGGMALYLIITLIILFCLNKSFNRGVGGNTIVDSIRYLYLLFGENIYSNRGLGGGNVTSIILALSYCLIFGGICKKVRHKKQKYIRFIFWCIIIICAPIYFNALYFVTGGSIHNLMQYSFVFLWIFPICIFDKIFSGYVQNLINYLTVILSIIFIYSNMIFCNTCYYSLALSYETSYALANRITAKIEMLDEWDGNMPVFFVGNFGITNPNDTDTKPMLHDEVKTATGISLKDYIYYNPYLLQIFINDYIGVKLPLTSNEKRVEILSNEKVKEMPCYPEKGFIDICDGVIVVKLSNEKIEDSKAVGYQNMYIR